MPNIRLWRRNVGLARPVHQTHLIFFGVKGEADLQGIIYPRGRFLAIEVKTNSGRLTKEQERWRDMIIKFGGAYIEARSLDDAISGVKKYN